MTHFFEKRDPWGQGLGLWVIVGMAFLAPLGVWAVGKIHLENDVRSWLPDDDPQSRILHWSQRHFPGDDSLLVSWQGSSISDPRIGRLQQALQGIEGNDGRLHGGLPYVARAISPLDLIRRMQQQDVPAEEALRRVSGVLVGAGNLKVRLSSAGRREAARVHDAIVRELNVRLGVEAKIVPPRASFHDPGEVGSDSLAAADESEEAEGDTAIAFSPPTHDFEIAWPAMHLNPRDVEAARQLVSHLPADASAAEDGEPLVEDCFLYPEAPVALSVVLSEAGTADPRVAVAAIRDRAVEAGIPEEDLRLGGRAVAGSELNREVKETAWNTRFPFWQLHKRSLLLLSALISVALAFFMLRSARLALLVLFVANYATLMSVALVPLTHGSMNMVLVVMPTLLSVLTLSAGIHVVNYWKHAAHRDMRTAVINACRMARQPCALASMTTSIGLISLVTSPLLPVRDLGLYSAIGCLVSLVVVLFGLPALLQYWPGRPPAEEDVNPRVWKRLAALLYRRRMVVVCASLFLFVGGAVGLHRFQTEIKVIRFFPDDARLVRDYNFLEENLAGIIPVDMVVRFNAQARQDLDFPDRMEIVREIQNRMREHPEISGSLSLADFQQVYSPPGPSVSLPLRLAQNRRYYEMERRIKDPQTGAQAFLATAKENISLETANGRYVSVRTGEELWRISAQVAVMSDYDYTALIGDWNDPHRRAGELNEIAAGVLSEHPGAGHVVTGMIPLFLRTQEAVLHSLITSFGLAFGVIAVVMMLLLKNPLAGLLSMIPNVMPVGVIFGLISWCGLAIDIGTMITASVALGIAVDGTLHLLTWFREGIRDGLSRQEAVTRALAHCGPAMWQTSAAVGLGLLVLAPADLLLISRFGWLMASLIGAALVADVIVLPALLAGPLGALIDRTEAVKETVPEASAVPAAAQFPVMSS